MRYPLIVLVLIFGNQPTTLDDKKVALALPKECGAEKARIATNMGETRGTEGRRA